MAYRYLKSPLQQQDQVCAQQRFRHATAQDPQAVRQQPDPVGGRPQRAGAVPQEPQPEGLPPEVCPHRSEACAARSFLLRKIFLSSTLW